MHLASTSWGTVETNTTNARTATPIIHVCNVPGTSQVAFICSTQLCCPAGQSQSLTSHQRTHCHLVLTCVSPTRSRPGARHPVTSGTCPAGSPGAPQSWARSENPRQGLGGPGRGKNPLALMLTRIWGGSLFLFSFSHFSQCTRFVQKLEAWAAASPVCVTSHIREGGGEVDEPGEAADEINAHEGILDGTGSSEHRP